MTPHLQSEHDKLRRHNVELRRITRTQLILGVLATVALVTAFATLVFGEGAQAALPYSLAGAALGLGAAGLGLWSSLRKA